MLLLLGEHLVFFVSSVARVGNTYSSRFVGPDAFTGSTFLAPDGFSTSLVHLWLRPMSSDAIGRMVRLFPTNFY